MTLFCEATVTAVTKGFCKHPAPLSSESAFFAAFPRFEASLGIPFFASQGSEAAAISSRISFILSSYFCCMSRAFLSNLKVEEDVYKDTAA